MKLLYVLPLVLIVNLKAEMLTEILNDSIEKNPDMNKQLKYYETTLQDLEIAKSGNLPSLDYQGSLGKEKTKMKELRVLILHTIITL